MTRPTLPLLLLSLTLLFLAANGLISGALLLSDPSGAPLGMDTSLLASTPFANFTLPALWLVVVYGLGSLVLLFALWRRPQWGLLTRLTAWTHEFWAWDLTLALGLVLLVWLIVQALMIRTMAPPQIMTFAIAVLLIGLPLVPPLRRYYRV